MSDKNFKVKNGLDANGAVTITQPDTSTTPLTIFANTLATGSDLFQVKRPDGTVRFAVGNDGALTVKSNINFTGGNMTMYPANSGQTALIVMGQTNQSVANLIVRAGTGQSGNLQEWRDENNNVAVSVGPDFAIRGIAGGFFGTANGNIVGVNYLGVKGWSASHIPFVVQGVASQTGDLTRWVDSSANTLAKVDASGSITAVDLTLSGNLTVNGTTTNLNSTNLVIEDKNIVLADVATPTDTTADGAGITIKGATDKTFNWVSSTKSFTTSEPLIVDGTNSTTVPMLVKVPTNQTTNAFEVMDGQGYSMFKVVAPAGGTAYNNGSIWIRPWGTGNVAAMGTDSYQGFYFVSPSTSSIKFGTGGGGKAFEIVVGDTFNRYKVQGTGTGIAPIFTTDGNDTDVNMHIYPKGAGKIGINTTSPTGYVHIKTPSATVTPLIVQATDSQTANIFEVQNSSATSLFVINGGSFSGSGTVSVGNTALAGTSFNSQLYVQNNNASRIGVIIKGTTSQTANLQEWQNSNGTVLAKIDASGNLIATNGTQYGKIGPGGFQSGGSSGILDIHYNGGNTTIRGGSAYNANTSLLVGTGYAAGIGMIIKGVASQTADLQQWQDSAGTVLTKIRANGQLNVIGAFSSASFGVLNYDPAWVAAKIQGAVSQTANLTEWQDSAGTVIAGVGPNGRIFAQGKSGNTDDLLYLRRADNNVNFYVDYNAELRGNFTIRLNQNPPIDTQAYLYSGTSSRSSLGVSGTGSINPTFYVKGTASQTSNLTEWQDSSGTALVSIQANGYIQGSYINLTSSGGILSSSSNQLYANNGSWLIVTPGPTKNGLIIKAFASQTANLMEFQDSSGTVLTYVTPTGHITATSSAISVLYTGGQLSTGTLGYLNATTFNAAVSPVVVRGASSQTADLTQWQDSAGTVLAQVRASGGQIVSGPLMTGVQLAATTFNATTIGLIVRGSASQSSSLTEWQDSAGTVLSKVDSAGNLNFLNKTVYANQVYVGTGSYLGATMHNQSGGAGEMRLLLRAHASQTANIQEWQNSSGNVIANIGISSASFMGTTASNLYTVGINAPANTNTMLTVGATGWTNFNQSATVHGIYTRQVNLGTGDMIGIYSQPVTGNATGHTNITSFSAGIRSAGGAGSVIANAYNFYANSPTMSSGTVTNLYGLYLNTQKDTNVTNAYGLYQAGVNDLNYLAGRTTIQSGSSSYVPFTIKAATSQTANLQEWQDSSGNVLSYIGNSTTYLGSVLTVGNDIKATYGIHGGGLTTAVSAMGTKSWSASMVAMVVRGAASQTANLEEWQDSTGTVLNRILSDGSNYSSASTHWIGYNRAADGVANYNFTTVSGATSFQAQITRGSGYNGALQLTNYGNSTILLTNGQAGSVVATVKGYASQSANLQQWQDSSGTVLANIASNGAITTAQGIVATGNYASSFGGSVAGGVILTVRANSASNRALLITGASGQTANLQEWQNNAGTVLASISPSGAFSAVTKSFVIKHPTKEGKLLRYGSLEGPENGVYVRGKIDSSNVIELPDYWIALIDESTITVNITPIGSSQNLYVEDIKDNKVYVSGGIDAKFFYTVFAERKDVTKLVVEE